MNTNTINYREEVRDFVREFPGSNTTKLWQLGESGRVPWSAVYEVARKSLQVALEEAQDAEETSDGWCDVCGDTREWCPR